MKPSLTLEELRRVARGLPSDGGHGYAGQLHDDAKAAANTAISLIQANILNEATIADLEAQVADRNKQIEDFISWLAAHDPSASVREMAERRLAEEVKAVRR